MLFALPIAGTTSRTALFIDITAAQIAEGGSLAGLLRFWTLASELCARYEHPCDEMPRKAWLSTSVSLRSAFLTNSTAYHQPPPRCSAAGFQRRRRHSADRCTGGQKLTIVDRTTTELTTARMFAPYALRLSTEAEHPTERYSFWASGRKGSNLDRHCQRKWAAFDDIATGARLARFDLADRDFVTTKMLAGGSFSVAWRDRKAFIRTLCLLAVWQELSGARPMAADRGEPASSSATSSEA